MDRQNPFQQQGQKPPYENFYNQKEGAKPGTSAYYRDEGNAYYSQKNYEKAIDSYTKGIVGNPMKI